MMAWEGWENDTFNKTLWLIKGYDKDFDNDKPVLVCKSYFYPKNESCN